MMVFHLSSCLRRISVDIDMVQGASSIQMLGTLSLRDISWMMGRKEPVDRLGDGLGGILSY